MFPETLFFPPMNALIYVDIVGEIDKGDIKSQKM